MGTASTLMRRVWPTCSFCGTIIATRRARKVEADHVKVKTEMLQMGFTERARVGAGRMSMH